MTSQSDLNQADNNPGPNADFIAGLKCFESHEYAAAAMLFRTAIECAGINDSFQNLYTSFLGLSRVLLGDAHGVKLCRKAATGETGDAEIYYNLALAEQYLQQRTHAELALRRGINLDPSHQGLAQLRQHLSKLDKGTEVPLRSRGTLMQHLLGRLFHTHRAGQGGDDSPDR